jgi:hypothetical protein
MVYRYFKYVSYWRYNKIRTMDQIRTVNKIITTIKLRKMIISDDDLFFLKSCFNQAYAAGWTESIHLHQVHNKSQVSKYSLNGDLLGVYDSIVEAAKASGYHEIYGRNTIHANLNGTTKHTKQDHIWKYTKEKSQCKNLKEKSV